MALRQIQVIMAIGFIHLGCLFRYKHAECGDVVHIWYSNQVPCIVYMYACKIVLALCIECSLSKMICTDQVLYVACVHRAQCMMPSVYTLKK